MEDSGSEGFGFLNLSENIPLSKEWDFEKNETKPTDHLNKSRVKAWWICTICKNSWRTHIYLRAEKGYGCTFCSLNRLHSDGRNSLAKLHPDLVEEWDTELNGDLSPRLVTAGSNKKVWWRCCECNNLWKTQINLRAKSDSGCNYCNSGRLHSDKRNSLEKMNRSLSSEWHPVLNGELLPSDVVVGSHKMVWWKCNSCEHEWRTSLVNRTKSNNPTGCPACCNQAVHIDGRNSLETSHPELVKEWDFERNEETPRDVVSGSSKRFWWVCATCSNQWKTSLSHRTGKDEKGCPSCNGGALHSNRINSLEAINPELAKEWHTSKNQPLKPSDVVVNTHTKVWWVCNTCEHEWETSPKQRKKHPNCPACENQVLHSDGRNSFQILHPELANEYHSKNKKPVSNLIGAGGNKPVWWICSTCDYEWKASPYPRTKGVGCPKCADHGFDLDSPAFYYCLKFEGPEGIMFYKGGITKNLDSRIANIKKSLNSINWPLWVEVLEKIYFETGVEARGLEVELLNCKEIRESVRESFDGSTELFNTNPITYARKAGLIND